MRRDCGWGGLQTLPLKVTFLHSFLAFMPLSFSTQSLTNRGLRLLLYNNFYRFHAISISRHSETDDNRLLSGIT